MIMVSPIQMYFKYSSPLKLFVLAGGKKSDVIELIHVDNQSQSDFLSKK